MSILTITREEFVKKIKSFLWRTGMMALSAVVIYLIENLGDFNLPQWTIIPLGLVLGEISKIINNNIATLKGLAGKNLEGDNNFKSKYFEEKV